MSAPASAAADRPPALRLLGVTKRFGHTTALRSVDLRVDEGESVVLLGANGAGKSTLLRIAATLTRPTHGKVEVGGADAGYDPNAARRSIGLLSHQSFLYDDLTAGENLQFYARLYGLSDPASVATAALTAVGLQHRADDRVRGFSRGMKQRTAVARALLHDPTLLLLDEPFAGLDVRSRDTLVTRIRESREQGRTLLLVTHDTRQGLSLSDRYVLLQSGQVVDEGRSADADPAGLEAQITSAPETGASSFLRAILAVLYKDLRTELRTKERLSAMSFFALLVVLIFNFAFEGGSVSLQSAAPGIFWVAVLFAGLLGLTRSFNQERENDALMGVLLTPADRGAYYLGKTAANAIAMAVMELLLLPMLAIFFNVAVAEHALRLLPICFFGTLGFAAVGTLFAAMSINTRLQEALLPMLTLPVLVPSMLAAVEMTTGVLAGEPLSALTGWLKISVVFAVLFLSACTLLFDYVVEE